MITLERKTRKTMQQKRLDILKEQTAIRDRYCHQCKFMDAGNREDCESCPAIKLLAECGEKLLEVSAIIREQKRTQAIETLREEGLTVETYEEADRAGLTGKEIAKVTGVAINAFYEWRHFNGFGKEVFDMEVAEYDALRGEGLSDPDIIRLKNIEDYQLANWKKCNNKCGNPKKSKKNYIYRLEIDGAFIARGTIAEISKQSEFKESTLEQYTRKSYMHKSKRREIKMILEEKR